MSNEVQEEQSTSPSQPAHGGGSNPLPPGQQSSKTSFSFTIILCLFLNVLSSAVSIAAYDHWFAQKVVAVDIKGFVEARRDELLAGKINEEDFKKSMDKLEASVTSIPKNKAVLLGNLVVRNVEVINP